jgi:colicin import membrane protein
MKKAYIYFAAPFAGLIFFGAVYWNFSANYEQVEADKLAKIKKAKQEKLMEDARLREKAVNDALASQEKRKKEKEIKDAKDRKDAEDRENAVLARNKAARDAEKLQKQADKLTKELAAAKEEIAKIQEDKKRHADEAAFLKSFVVEVESNAKGLNAVLEKIAAADAAAEAAAKAAAAAAAAAKK